jgi:deoxyribose-phosphate aldolase
VLRDVGEVVDACHASHALCKVILETGLLTTAEKQRGCAIAADAGADFVKTSTGFSQPGATVEDVTLISGLVKPKGLGVKAAGGIRTLADVQRMVTAGATRIGTRSGVAILREVQ